jgi:uncharacterized protein with HEPN domain
MKPTDKERIGHIRDAIEKITNYTKGCTEKKFLENEMLQDAVLMQFSNMGEAVVHIEPSILEKHPYPWHLVRSFRNYIAHEYFGINMKKVWSTVIIELPGLQKVMQKMCDTEL